MSLAMVHMDAKRYDKSLAQLDQALAIYRKSRTARKGDLDYPHVLGTIGNVLREKGELAEAETYYRKAIAALKESGDSEHERAGAIYVGMGMTLSEMGKQDEAIPFFQRTIGPWEAMKKDHLNLGYPLTGIGVAHLRAGRAARAVAPLERALAIRTNNKGRPQNRADTELALARALWQTGRDRKRAVTLAQAALKRLEPLGEREARRAKETRAWLAAHQL
jgi:tetratricopeptide (TPR) repeat protein